MKNLSLAEYDPTRKIYSKAIKKLITNTSIIIKSNVVYHILKAEMSVSFRRSPRAKANNYTLKGELVCYPSF